MSVGLNAGRNDQNTLGNQRSAFSIPFHFSGNANIIGNALMNISDDEEGKTAINNCANE